MRIALLILAAGCTSPAEPDPVDPGPPLDPNVASWWPDTAPMDGVQRVVFMGDSITAGYGLNQVSNRYSRLLVENRDDSWPEWAGDDLTARYGPLEVVDVSRSGAETPDLAGSQLTRLLEEVGPVAPGPTLAYVTIGGNDFITALLGADLDGLADLVEDNLREVADALADPVRFPDGSLMLVTNVYEPTDGDGQVDECFFGLDMVGFQPELDDLNQRTLDLAQELGFAWVDLRGHFLGHGFRAEDTTNPYHEPDDASLWFQDDCIHPNRRGHHELRRLFLAATDGVPFTLP